MVFLHQRVNDAAACPSPEPDKPLPVPMRPPEVAEPLRADFCHIKVFCLSSEILDLFLELFKLFLCCSRFFRDLFL